MNPTSDTDNLGFELQVVGELNDDHLRALAQWAIEIAEADEE